MKKTGSEIITTLLEMHGVTTVAGIPGGSILPLYDELNRSNIKHVLVRHEQAAGFIAQGMARSTGSVAVCMATSGPGAMNLLTAIADARCDSVPIIAITGQVNTTLLGTDAFQEADTFGLSFSITKHSVMVKDAKDLLTVIPEAFKIAKNGRPGPVLIDVPRNVQLQTVEFDAWPEIEDVKIKDNANVRFHTPASEYKEKMESICGLMKDAKKPVLFLGGGCNSVEAAKELEKFLAQYKMPVTVSLMGIGAVPKSADVWTGMVGMHGSYAANYAMYNSDLVIAAGVRFDDRATGVVSKFCPNAKLVHIDIDAAEVDKIIESNVSVVADVESVFPILTTLVSEKKGDFASGAADRKNWMAEIAKVRAETDSITEGRPKDADKTNPREFISTIPQVAEKAGIKGDDLVVTTDVGQHQMFAAQYYPVEKARTFLTSGSLGTMGFGLPAALGAALANPDKRVVCFSGDGSIMMNIQEMATLAEQNLAVTVIIFVNGTLGMVYQQQKYLFDKNYSASVFGKNPDILKIAEGFGIETVNADTDKEWYMKAFDAKRANKPCVVTVTVGSEEDVLPFVPGGKANIDAIRSLEKLN
ncbi:MAG: biosynthetic-type acetolactate synthase large subunit [Treponema sp.]|nr:biosynthetic-type acetolactate synthase large subunit [Treponema sp.]